MAAAACAFALQKLDKCPVGDCDGDCVSGLQAGAQVDDMQSAAQNVHFNITFNVDKAFNGTGVLYYQVNEGPTFNDPLTGNGARLMEFPQPTGQQKVTWGIALDCNPESSGDEQQYSFSVVACEGECDQFGPKKHPNTKVWNTTTTLFKGCLPAA